MSADAVRVTQIVFDLHGGGMETLVAAMAKRWHGGDAVRMSIITLSGRLGRVGAAVAPLVEQFHVLSLRPGLSMIAPVGLVRAIRETRPAVVHLHSGAWYKGALAARLAGVRRVIYTEHGREHNDPAILRYLDRLASMSTSRVVAVSERLGNYMMGSVGVSPGRVVTIPNGIDVDAFTPGPASPRLRRSLGIPDNALVLGSVGRIEPVKNYGGLVEAYARLRAYDFGRPLVLVIFGEGSDRGAVEAVVDRVGVRDGVLLPGWVEQPADAYRLLDVFAMTSLSEGMSVSLMEAMACGLCPVVTDVGSNAEVLGPELAGQVVPLGDHESFVQIVRRALTAAEHRYASGALARTRAVSHHSLDRMMRSYERLYRGELSP